MKNLYPLLSYKSKILGFLSIALGFILIGYSIIIKKINEDIVIWLVCFGLFCLGYRKERDETGQEDENNKYMLFRYHAFRITFGLTTVVILICSSSFIFNRDPINISCLYALLFFSLSYNIIYFFVKKRALKNLRKK